MTIVTNWTDKSYGDTLAASNELLRAAQDLNEAIGSGGGATGPDDVLKALLSIREKVISMEVRLLGLRFPNANKMPS